MIEVKKILPFVLSAMIAINGCVPVPDPKTSFKKGAYPEIAAFPLQSEGEFQTQTGRTR